MSHTSGTATDYLDLLDKLDAFLTDTGHAWGKAFSGVGDGDLVDYIGTATSVAETFTITFTTATDFTVSGSTTGALAAGTVGTPYTSAVIEFTIEAGTTPFAAGDVFTIQTSPAWQRLREAGCADSNKRTSDLSDLENALSTSTSYAYSAATTCYIEWEMHRATEVSQFLMQVDLASYAPNSFNLQYKDNAGDPWATAQSWTGQTWGNSESRFFTLSSAPGAHKYWRFNVTSAPVSGIRIKQLQLAEKVGDTYNIGERYETIWQAPGLDGQQEINIGCRTYGRTNTDTYGLGFCAWRQTDGALSATAQPNSNSYKALSMINSPIAYWLIVNGQRAIVAVKFSGIYQFAYLGYGNPYETPTVHPFPAIIGASHANLALRYNSTDTGYRFPVDPGVGLEAFYPDGQWRKHQNRASGGNPPDGTSDGNTPGKVWPTHISPYNYSNSSVRRPTDWRENIDSSRPLIPVVLIHYADPVHFWGEFDGVYWTTGFNTVAEAIIREGLFDHLVINNVYRTDVQDYAALRLD